MNRDGRYETDVSVSEAVEQIRQAVEKKKLLHKRGVRLALDATLTPGLALDRVVREFRRQHGEWVQSLGFDSAWLVGPDASLVHRIDVSNEP